MTGPNDTLTWLIREARAEGMRHAASIARMAMVTNPTADELTCSICADAIRSQIEAERQKP